MQKRLLGHRSDFQHMNLKNRGRDCQSSLRHTFGLALLAPGRYDRGGPQVSTTMNSLLRLATLAFQILIKQATRDCPPGSRSVFSIPLPESASGITEADQPAHALAQDMLPNSSLLSRLYTNFGFGRNQLGHIRAKTADQPSHALAQEKCHRI